MNLSIVKFNSTTDPDGTLSGTQMCDSPVVAKVRVNPGSFSDNTSAHKIKIKAVDMGTNREEYLEIAAENGDEFTVDIQTMLRALAGDVSIDFAKLADPEERANAFSLPIKRYYLALGGSYMQNGQIVDDFTFGNEERLTDPMYAIRGSLTEVERLRLGNKPITLDKDLVLSRKPTTGQIITPGFTDITVTLPKCNGDYTQGAHKVSFTDYTSSNAQYVGNTKQFLFINSFHVPETACAVCLESLDVDIEPKVYRRETKISRIPSLINNTHVVHKTMYRQFNMSSGFCSREWAEWWATEFLHSSAIWMKDGDMWLPVTVEPSNKNVRIYDESKAEAIHVDFKVTMTLTDSGCKTLF